MELLHSARLEVLANFTPLSPGAVAVEPVDIWGDPIAADESEDDEAYRLLMPLNAVCSLIERMRQDPAAVSLHRPICDTFLARMADSCRSPLLRSALLDAVHDVDAGNLAGALTTLRAIAA